MEIFLEKWLNHLTTYSNAVSVTLHYKSSQPQLIEIASMSLF